MSSELAVPFYSQQTNCADLKKIAVHRGEMLGIFIATKDAG